MNIEDVILGLLDGASTFNFNALIKAIGLGLLVIWFFVIVWVWLDSGDRSRSIFFRVISVIGVAIFNVLGLIIYLLIRPKTFVDDDYWTELERRYLLYETSELGDCESCGFQLRPGFNVCPNCSFPVKLECSNCEMMIDRNWQFCPYCSTAQEPLSQKDLDMRTASLVTGMSVKKEKIDNVETVMEDEQMVKGKDEDEDLTNDPDINDPDDNTENEDNSAELISVTENEPEAKDDISQNGKTETDDQVPSSSRKPDPASRLGQAVLSGIYGLGEKIHMTALRISGPLNQGNSSESDGIEPSETDEGEGIELTTEEQVDGSKNEKEIKGKKSVKKGKQKSSKKKNKNKNR